MNIFEFIRNLIFGEPQVGNAVKSLNKAVNKVQKAAEYQARKAELQRQAAERAKLAAENAVKEAGRCEKVGKNLADLLAIDL